jgi:hypothetical protein
VAKLTLKIKISLCKNLKRSGFKCLNIDKVTMVGQQLLIKDEEADDNYLISLVIFYWVSYLQVKFNTS